MQKISAQNKPNTDSHNSWYTAHNRVPIGNDLMPLNVPLDSINAALLARRLSLSQKLSLALTKTAYIGMMQPEGFNAPARIYAVKGKEGLFLSYPQGYTGEFRIWEARAEKDRR